MVFFLFSPCPPWPSCSIFSPPTSSPAPNPQAPSHQVLSHRAAHAHKRAASSTRLRIWLAGVVASSFVLRTRATTASRLTGCLRPLNMCLRLKPTSWQPSSHPATSPHLGLGLREEWRAAGDSEPFNWDLPPATPMPRCSAAKTPRHARAIESAAPLAMSTSSRTTSCATIAAAPFAHFRHR